MAELKPIIEQSMVQYAGAVLQSRALVDVRDCLKPSARQIFYCMDKYKYIANKPFQKTMAAIGDAMKHFYIHGDSSCEGIIMRAGQSFAMRYPLIEVKGNGGTLLSSGNWAAPRYTEARLSKLASYLFNDIGKDTIDDWRDNYADNEQYPSVLPTKGFYNIVNGSSGLGIGMACSAPQYNLKELNEALIHLIDNPNCDFEEIYCAPDFATGAILYNESEVKESMKNGSGKACKLRSVVEFDSEERCFVVTEIPYSVYTNTICGQLEEIINGESNPGIERFNDLTGTKPLIKIYLAKRADPDRVLKYLYKNTSLQYHYGINFTMLDNGRFPKVFTWKEMLQAHIDHERVVYRRAFEYDLNKIKNRIHIIDGMLICVAKIEEVVQTIKNSSSTAAASVALQKNFLLDEEQAKAVLDIKLNRLAHLEVEKLKSERTELLIKAETIEKILNNEELFKEEIKKGLREVINKFGDSRRTKIMNLEIDKEDETPIEKKTLIVHLTNQGNLYTFESSSLYSQKRGGKGIKVKMNKDESIIDTISDTNENKCLIFTNEGKAYNLCLNDLPIEQKVNTCEFFNFNENEKVILIVPYSNIDNKYVIFATKKGMIKKTSLKEYKSKKSQGIIGLKLKDDDCLVSAAVVDNNDSFAFLTKTGNYLIINTETISDTGRATMGVIGIKLSNNDEVVDAKPVPKEAKEIISLSSCGNTKKTPYSEFNIGNRATKGIVLQKLKEDDSMVSFNFINNEDKEVAFISNKGIIKISLEEIPLLSRSTMGIKSKQLNNEEYMIDILKVNEG